MHQHNQLESFCGPHPTKELANLQDFCILVSFLSKLRKITQMECQSDGYAVQGIITMERGDTLEGVRLIEQAATAGSTFAELLQCVQDWRGAINPDLDKLAALSDKIPFVNAILAKMYAGYEDENLQNDQLAAYCYLKADEKACLGKRGARWLLGYHRSGANLSLSERDIQRLQILAGETPVDNEESTSNRDEALEASVSSILQEAMTERSCTKGMV